MKNIKTNTYLYIVLLFLICASCFQIYPSKEEVKEAQCWCDSSKTLQTWIKLEFEHFDRKDFEKDNKKILLEIKNSVGRTILKTTDTVDLIVERGALYYCNYTISFDKGLGSKIEISFGNFKYAIDSIGLMPRYVSSGMGGGTRPELHACTVNNINVNRRRHQPKFENTFIIYKDSI